MSSDGTYPSRGSRRAGRDAPAPRRASAGAATAILILTAILGFGGGALLSNAGGDDPQAPAAASDDGAGGSTDAPDSEATEGSDESPAPDDGTILAQSSYDGGQATAADGGECGDCDYIDFSVEAPSLTGETLWLERSLDGGTTWEQFGTSPRSVTLDSSGKGTDQIFSGRAGENQFRWVLRDGSTVVQASNVITIELVAQS
ncbi:MAG TPA: hypothetical protein VFZ63_12140 [Jiangellaceae bacterium]